MLLKGNKKCFITDLTKEIAQNAMKPFHRNNPSTKIAFNNQPHPSVFVRKGEKKDENLNSFIRMFSKTAMKVVEISTAKIADMVERNIDNDTLITVDGAFSNKIIVPSFCRRNIDVSHIIRIFLFNSAQENT